METKIHIMMVMQPSQTTNQSFSVVTSAAEVETQITEEASPALKDPSTILTATRARRLGLKKDPGKIDHLTTTTVMVIASSEVEDTTTTLREAMVETTTTSALTNATILTSAIADHTVKISPKDSMEEKILETNLTACPSEAETAVQNAVERECVVEASEVTTKIVSVEVPSGEVKTTFSAVETLVHSVEAMLEIAVVEECVEVDKEPFNQAHTRVVMEEKSPSLKKLRATTYIEKRA